MASERQRVFPLVHSMRAVAALSVLAYHGLFKAYLVQHPGSVLAPYAAHLDVGVSVFFLISAFVLYRPMVAARLHGEAMSDPQAYGRRRLLRIVPAYWVALLVAGIAGASYLGYPAIFSGQGVPAYFGFLQIYSPDTAGGGINVAWTLCVELTFYAFLPLWAIAMRRLRPRGGLRSEMVALGLLFAASLAWQALAVHSTNPNGFGLSAARWLEPLPNFLDQFAVGMALAVASVAWEQGRGPAWLLRRPRIAWVLAAVAFWVVSTQLGLHGAQGDHLTAASYVARHQLYTVVALGLLWPAVFGSRRGGRALAFVGTISYGIYLYHIPVLLTLAKAWGLPDGAGALAAWLAAGVACTIALAWLSWHLVERPALRLAGTSGPRWYRRWRPMISNGRPAQISSPD
jgi:peptidoglycan/LPS O-acetylase OafA/YrhL